MSWKIEKDLCRCCHAEGSFINLAQPLVNSGQQEIYSDMLQQTLDIALTPMNGILCEMTFTICESCILRLRDASNFKRQVLSCEERFKDMFQDVMKALSPSFEVKQELPLTTANDVKEIKVECENDVDEEEDDSFHQRFSDSEEEKLLVDVKKEEPKKDKGKSKAKPKPVKRPKRQSVKKKKPKDGDVILKQPEVKPQKGDQIEDHQFTVTTSGDGTRSFTCNVCGKPFKDRRCASQHHKHVHLKMRPKQRTCYLCKVKVAPYMKAAHMEEAHGVPAPLCGICNKKFSYPNQLLRHQKVVHMGEKQFECNSCDLKFATQSKLAYHQVKHTGVRTFKCMYCDKAFKWRKNLTPHIMMHLNDKRQVCHICQEAFVQYSSLKYHMARRHPEIV